VEFCVSKKNIDYEKSILYCDSTISCFRFLKHHMWQAFPILNFNLTKNSFYGYAKGDRGVKASRFFILPGTCVSKLNLIDKKSPASGGTFFMMEQLSSL